MAEVTRGTADFALRAFRAPSGLLDAESSWTRDQYMLAVCAGGYPEVRRLRSAMARNAWYDGYLTTIITRDISVFADLDRVTAKNYLTCLDTVFLTTEVPAWSTSLSSRLSKTPKSYVTDSGLAAHLMGVTEYDLARVGHPAVGGLVETFVLTELLKLKAVSEVPFTIWQLRENQDREVDFILEDPAGAIVAIEVKATTSPGSDTARHLRWLREKAGDRFTAGIVLHLGTRAASFGDSIYALPVSALWGHATEPA